MGKWGSEKGGQVLSRPRQQQARRNEPCICGKVPTSRHNYNTDRVNAYGPFP